MKRRAPLLVAVLLAAACLAACGTDPDTEARAAGAAAAETRCVDANTHFYPNNRPSDVDTMHADAGLLQLKKFSTLTVVGTVTAVGADVRYGEDGRLGYAPVTIRPTETLKGTAPTEIRVGFYSQTINGHHFTDPAHPVPAVGACGIWFLVPWGKEIGFDGFGSVSNTSQLLFNAKGEYTSTHNDHYPAFEEAEKLGSRDKILALLRSTP